MDSWWWIVEYNYGGGSKFKTKSIRRDCMFFAFARKRPAAAYIYNICICTLQYIIRWGRAYTYMHICGIVEGDDD